MYMKTNELGWKENHGIQNSGTEHAREQNSRQETSTENLRELYCKALQKT